MKTNNNISITNIPDGLVIATDRMTSVETVTVAVLVKTGSRNESPEINGISHFLEHMAFKGTRTRTLKHIAEEFDEMGGYFNAYTSREVTVYYAKVITENLVKAVDIIADILLNSIYDEQEMDKERDVIQQELAQTIDTPDDIVFDYFQAKAYPDQPFGRTILGTSDFLRSVSREQLLNYVDKRYGRKSIKIVAAGNIDHKMFETLVLEKFATLKTEADIEYESARYIGGIHLENRSLEQVNIVFGVPGVAYTDPDYYVQQILGAIAGGGMSSRLFQEIREKRGLVYTVSAYGAGYKDCGMFNIYAGTSPEKVNEYLEVTTHELLRLQNDITEQEINRAKTQIKTQIAISLESTTSRAEKLAYYLASYGRYIDLEELMQKIESVNRERLSELANRLFHQNVRPTVAAIGKVENIHQYDEIMNMMQKAIK